MNKETKCVIDNLTLEKGRLRLLIQIFARLQMFEGVGVANQTNAFRRNCTLEVKNILSTNMT